ncbi:hypothetical protein [Streptomyces sp. NPDC048272]|uniref:hypothetical protein n=1 Tax=Streptomyces sp. NPDC048272 TaxID=3154616 RepID=UPI00342ABF9C
MTTTSLLIARIFTFESRTFFITADVHDSLLRMWRLEGLLNVLNFPDGTTLRELHSCGREVAEALGLTRDEWPADWMARPYHNPEPARERNRSTVLALARAYSEATGHLAYKTACYSGCVVAWYCRNHAPAAAAC